MKNKENTLSLQNFLKLNRLHYAIENLDDTHKVLKIYFDGDLKISESSPYTCSDPCEKVLYEHIVETCFMNNIEIITNEGYSKLKTSTKAGQARIIVSLFIGITALLFWIKLNDTVVYGSQLLSIFMLPASIIGFFMAVAEVIQMKREKEILEKWNSGVLIKESSERYREYLKNKEIGLKTYKTDKSIEEYMQQIGDSFIALRKLEHKNKLIWAVDVGYGQFCYTGDTPGEAFHKAVCTK